MPSRIFVMSATNDAVKSVTDPGNRKTEFVYDTRGRQIKTILPDDSETLTTYNPRGEVTGRSGSQTYPVTYTYDYAGRQQTMTTYGTEEATTTWIYEPATGFLAEKNYPGETDDGVIDRDYTYTAAGRLLTRKWERGVTTTYGYDNGGRLASVSYSNETNGHTTPNLAYTYDALGRIDEVTRGGVLHAKHTYRNSDLQRLAETQQIDSLHQAVTYTYEDGTNGTLQGRPNGFTFADGGATWSYDNSGRLATVSGGGLQPTGPFTYSYETGSAHLVETITGPEHTVTNEWEPNRDVLAFKQNDLPGGPLSKFTYSINSLGQRIGLTPTGSAFANTTPFVWGYNPRGELTSATRNGLTAFERAYSYDGIGNRLTATDHTAATTSYFANTGATTAGGNALNQYAKINYPGSATIEPQHDIDGNLKSGPVPGPNGLNAGVPIPANATLTWDAENRLVEAVVGSVTIAYAYDHQSRLIAATVGGVTTRYLYDGWNRIAEYQQNGTGHELKKSYLWGMDMSGSMQGAGGVGGLLAMTVHGTTTTTFYPTYDGNGNVSEYINESGADVAHFEYDPFGNLTVDRDSNANQFPYRFSTKPQDLTTGLLYYGYRYYDPVTGRWPSRDPIGESGGINLYGFVGNNGVSLNDLLGLSINSIISTLLDSSINRTMTPIVGYQTNIPVGLTILKQIWNRYGNSGTRSFVVSYGNVTGGAGGYRPIWLFADEMILERNVTDETIIHEMTHAYNHMMGSAREFHYDERTASVMEHIYTISKNLIDKVENPITNFCFNGSNCPESSGKTWVNIWSSFGQTDDWGVTGGTTITQQDINYIHTNFRTSLKCGKIASDLNTLLSSRGGCFLLSCDSESPDEINGIRIYKPRKPISMSLR